MAELPPLAVEKQKENIIAYFKQYGWDVSDLDFYSGGSNVYKATKQVLIDGFVDRYFMEFIIIYDSSGQVHTSAIKCYPTTVDFFDQG